MSKDEKDIEKLVLIELMRLNNTIVGLTLGLIAGLTIFIATNILILRGGAVVGPHLSLLGQFFIGYQVTFMGSIIGFLYGLVTGFIVGYVFAGLYNWLAYLRENKRSPKSS